MFEGDSKAIYQPMSCVQRFPPSENILRREDGTGYGRRQLYIRQDRKCIYCGQEVVWKWWTVDHKTPESRGGGGGSNKVGACYTCNHAKGNMTFDEFLSTDYLPRERRVELLGFYRVPTQYRRSKKNHRQRLKQSSHLDPLLPNPIPV